MLVALEGGNLANTDDTWTNGIIIDKHDKTASKYEIKDIDGQTYMFFEWKSGDYVFKGLTPEYYVMKKVDSKDYTAYEVPHIEDKIDYPFVDDPKMRGTWQSVDFVKNNENFKPGEKSFPDDLYLTGLTISENGEMTASTALGDSPKDMLTWTKDLIIDKADRTASKCEIKEIDGETYMFFEWKSGDYLFRGMKPRCYVLKKVE